ncbi:hypothetical protein L211DRAFT_837154, partial [Terfezia boudieri ATCC MYA-4762]
MNRPNRSPAACFRAWVPSTVLTVNFRGHMAHSTASISEFYLLPCVKKLGDLSDPVCFVVGAIVVGYFYRRMKFRQV